MHVRDDFQKPEMLVIDALPWAASPAPGVDRRMLDRVGGEVARATTIVRYAPGSRFDSHTHDEGEEFLVLEGVFQDEHGDYPAGTYVRNPPGSSHAPKSDGGCTIFVKLRQMPPGERVVVRTPWPMPDADAGSASHLPLHQDGKRGVEVSMQTLAAGTHEIDERGHELLLLDGAIRIGETHLESMAWVRWPAGASARMEVERTATLWWKSGHLPGPTTPER